MKNLVIISSLINISDNPLSYTNTRSVFSPLERYNQTLHTIESLDRIPNKEVVLVETSDISEEMEYEIKNRVDTFFNFKDNAELRERTDGKAKGAAEGSQLYELIKNINLDNYSSIIKISGRYWLNENFNFKEYEKEKSFFRMSPDGGSLSTVLYKIDKKHFSLYKKTLNFCTTSDNMHEADFLDFFKSVYINKEVLGISGFVSVDGNFVNL